MIQVNVKEVRADEDLKMSGGVESRHAGTNQGVGKPEIPSTTKAAQVVNGEELSATGHVGADLEKTAHTRHYPNRKESSGSSAPPAQPSKPFDRKAYMKKYMEDYRQKPVVCPNCGHTFSKLKRVKE